MPLLLASARSDVHLTLAALIVGVLLGGIGHLTRTSWLIVLAILIIGSDMAYFTLALRPGAG